MLYNAWFPSLLKCPLQLTGEGIHSQDALGEICRFYSQRALLLLVSHSVCSSVLVWTDKTLRKCEVRVSPKVHGKWDEKSSLFWYKNNLKFMRLEVFKKISRKICVT